MQGSVFLTLKSEFFLLYLIYLLFFIFLEVNKYLIVNNWRLFWYVFSERICKQCSSWLCGTAVEILVEPIRRPWGWPKVWNYKVDNGSCDWGKQQFFTVIEMWLPDWCVLSLVSPSTSDSYVIFFTEYYIFMYIRNKCIIIFLVCFKVLFQLHADTI